MGTLVSGLACQDSNTKTGPADPDMGSRIVVDQSLPPDVNVPDAMVVRIWDSSVPVDATVVDAAPPQVCPRLGMRESCLLEGLLGPCAEGERTCNVTSWSQCVPVTFPRIEVCDGLDNDCDGEINESPSGLPSGPQNPTLFVSCYTGAPGTSKSGPCRSGISVCQEVVANCGHPNWVIDQPVARSLLVEHSPEHAGEAVRAPGFWGPCNVRMRRLLTAAARGGVQVGKGAGAVVGGARRVGAPGGWVGPVLHHA